MLLRFARCAALLIPTALLASACSNPPTPGDGFESVDVSHPDVTATDTPSVDTGGMIDAPIDMPAVDVAPDVTPTDTQIIVPDVPPDDVPQPTGPFFCTLGQALPGVTAPAGYCVRRFTPGRVHARAIAIAADGDVFISSPTQGGAGGGSGSVGAIEVLSDDNYDGVAEEHVFLNSLPDVHGLALGANAVYFTRTDGVYSTPYMLGQRAATTMALVAPLPDPRSVHRWTHGLGITRGGALYVTTGINGASCPDANVGSIASIANGTTTMVATGFRNPMYMRCHYRDETCFASELGDDGGGGFGAHEKLLMIHPATNYGYACCAGPNQPMFGATMSCASITNEEAQFPLNDTPFGMDWERGRWPAPYAHMLVVAKHGSFYSSPLYHNTGIYFAPSDPVTHAPTAAFQLLVGGFGPGPQEGSPNPASELRRATDVAFSPDGRLFFVDDIADAVYWVAPGTLRMPAH